MKNHTERVQTLQQTHPNARLDCPLDCQRVCRNPEFCAHYDPEQEECIHVLAAQAQVRAAEAHERIAETLEAVVHRDYNGPNKHLRIKGQIDTGNE